MSTNIPVESSTFAFNSTDSITSTIVAQTSEPTLRMELQFKSNLDDQVLKASLYKLVTAEPILSSRLINKSKPVWAKNTYSSAQYLEELDNFDEYQEFKRKPVDIHTGPLIQCALYKTPGESIFLIKLAHEVADGFGAKQAATRIAKNYREYKENSSINSDIGQKSDAVNRSSLKLLKAIPLLALFRLFIIYCKDKRDMFGPGKSVNVSHKIYDNINPGTVSTSLDSEFTETLRTTARENDVTLNDLLLTAFLRSLAENSEDPEELFRICMTVNLRRYVADPESLPISNLSNIECINLNRNLGSSFEETLSKVSEIIKHKKKNWIGLSIIYDLIMQKPFSFKTRRRLHAGFVKKTVENKNTAFLLTNVGKVDEDSLVMESRPIKIEMLGPVVFSPFWNTVVWESNDQIHFSAGIYNYEQRKTKIKTLHQKVMQQLANFSNYSNDYIPSKVKDFTS